MMLHDVKHEGISTFLQCIDNHKMMLLLLFANLVWNLLQSQPVMHLYINIYIASAPALPLARRMHAYYEPMDAYYDPMDA